MTWLLLAIAYGTVGVGVGVFVFLHSLINGHGWRVAMTAAVYGLLAWPVVLWYEFRK